MLFTISVEFAHKSHNTQELLQYSGKFATMLAGKKVRIMISAVRMFANNYASAQNQARQNMISQRYNEIYSHELAHKRAGGNLVGNIVIERDENGVPVGGHVAIKMPALDKNNPDKTIKDANTVINSAMAPSDPSAQDFKVASQAREIKSQAESYKRTHPESGKKLNVMA